MSDTPVDNSKRTWMIASGCAGAAGGIAAAVPFVSSMMPSERAKAAGAAVEADISGLKPGEKLTVEWRGKPVWIVRRTPEQLAALPKLDPQLADPLRRRTMPRTDGARANPKSLSQWVFARIWAVPLLTSSRRDHSRRCRTTGKVGSSALVMDRRSTWPGGSTRTCRLLTTLRCRPICSFPTASC